MGVTIMLCLYLFRASSISILPKAAEVLDTQYSIPAISL